jgi:hypothetical protein
VGIDPEEGKNDDCDSGKHVDIDPEEGGKEEDRTGLKTLLGSFRCI